MELIRRPVIIKLLSGLLNLLVCLNTIIIILSRQEYFDQGDIYPFVFWTIPIAAAISYSGVTLLHLIRVKNRLLRVLFIFFISAVISFGWVNCVYLFLGPWINTFSFPIFYLWIIGNTIQFLFLDLILPVQEGQQKISKTLVRLIQFPLILIVSVIAIISFSFLFDYLTKPEKELYLIPNNFSGEFKVVYGEHCGINPPFENGRRVMKIPSNGLLIIQPEFKAGIVNNEYYLFDKNGNRKRLNELIDYKERLTKSPGVIMDGSGRIGGAMPDGGSSSESPLAIHYSAFTVFNKDTTSLSDRELYLKQQKFDSLVIALVNDCRGKIKNYK